jgi:hypothetical protein
MKILLLLLLSGTATGATLGCYPPHLPLDLSEDGFHMRLYNTNMERYTRCVERKEEDTRLRDSALSFHDWHNEE